MLLKEIEPSADTSIQLSFRNKTGRAIRDAEIISNQENDDENFISKIDSEGSDW